MWSTGEGGTGCLHRWRTTGTAERWGGETELTSAGLLPVLTRLQKDVRFRMRKKNGKDVLLENRSSHFSVNWPGSRGFLLCLSISRPFQGAQRTPQNWVKANALVYSLTENEQEMKKSNPTTSAAITVKHLKIILPGMLLIRIALTNDFFLLFKGVEFKLNEIPTFFPLQKWL